MTPDVVSAQREMPSLTKQAGWLLIAKVVGFVLSFAVPLIVVRVLDQKEFGLYKQIFLMMGTAVPLLTFVFYMNVFYFLPRMPAAGPKIVLNVLIVHAIVGIGSMSILLGHPGLLEKLFGNADLVPYTSLIAVVLCLTIIGYFLEVVATANQDVKYSTIFIISAQFTKGVAMISAALIAGTLQALLYAAIFQAVVQCCALGWYLQKRFPGFLDRPDWHLLRDQLKYAIPLGLAANATLAHTDLHMYMVAHSFSPAEYAIYAVGCFQLPLIGLLHESVNSVLIPRISYLQQRDEKREITVLIAAAMRKLGLVFWPMYVFLTVMAAEFLTFLYTSRYTASRPIFVINLITVPLTLLLYDPVIRAYTQHLGFLLKLRFAEIAMIAIGVYFGIMLFGMQGAILAVTAVVVADYLAITYKAIHILKISRRDLPLFADLGKIALAAFIAGLAAEVVRRLMAGFHPLPVLLCSGVLFCVVYGAAVLGFEIPTKEETGMIRSMLMYIGRVLKLA